MTTQDYIQELITWNKTHNLVAKNEIHNLDEHLADSLSLCIELDNYSYDTIIDIGSGGGFPAIPVAFWLKEHQKTTQIIVTDIVSKKLTFLKWCTAKFDLNIDVKNLNFPFLFDNPCLIISRAFSSIANILRWRDAHAPLATEFLLLKGDSVEQELQEAKITNYQLIKNPRGYIVRFTHSNSSL